METRSARPGQRLKSFVKSIRFRLTLLNTAILAVILAVFSVFVYTRQAQDLTIQAESQLELKAQQLEVLYRVSGLFDLDHPHFQAPDLANARGSGLLGDGMILSLIGPTGLSLQQAGEVNSTAINLIVQSWQSSNPVPGARFYSMPYQLTPTDPKQVDYIFLVNPLITDRSSVGLIVLGRPVDPDGQLQALVITLLLGSLATLALTVAGGYWLASRAMAPVRTITRTARGISESDLHQRLKLGTQDELGELADTFDAMLDRLQGAFDRQRQFTADASHELRTPLTIIGLEAEQALERRRSTEDYERSLKVIRSENDFMGRLVNDLLTLARMDAGQTELKTEPVDLGDVGMEVAERLASLAHRNGIALECGDLPEVMVQGDRRLILQMLTNLVENAIKYAGGEGHHIYLETGSRTDQGRKWAWARVGDDGPGIASEHLIHLFDRFYRVDQARSRDEDGREGDDGSKSPDGSGLGLSIVQWIASAHGGKVSVQSEPGKGTVFEIQLPELAPEVK